MPLSDTQFVNSFVTRTNGLVYGIDLKSRKGNNFKRLIRVFPLGYKLSSVFPKWDDRR